jgi:hypothetical protein
MIDNKNKRKPGDTILTDVQKEMAQPRMSKSARMAAQNLDRTRTPEMPRSIMPGTVDRLIPSPRPSQPEKAQIAIKGADQGYRDLRIENSLTDEHGDEVRLKKGADVEITVTAKPVVLNLDD